MERAFHSVVQSVGNEELFFVGQHAERKLNALQNSATSWVADLARKTRALYRMYQDHVSGELVLTSDSVTVLAAALFYFVNPHDVIPDHTPGVGYLDDAFVVNTCINALARSHPRELGRYMKRETSNA